MDVDGIDPRRLGVDGFVAFVAEASAGAAGDVGALDPDAFGRLIGRASGAQLDAVMASDLRAGILDVVFRRMPHQLRADRAADVDAVVHWRITGRPDGGADTYELVVRHGTCTVASPPEHAPRATLMMSGRRFLELISGAGNPVTMFLLRRVRVDGDMALAARMGELFTRPGAAADPSS